MPPSPPTWPPAAIKQQWGMFDHYCVKCHNFTDWAGKIAFDTMTPDQIASNQKIFETAIRKLRGGLMPPPGKPHPPATEVASFTGELASYLDEVEAAKGPNPGNVGLHRLNRAEYANAVRDLLGVTVDPSALLPPDNTKDGYDNMAAVLQVSPSFLEQYVSAAHTVATMAIGNPAANPGSATYVNEGTSSDKRHVEGLPLGTRGGMVVKHEFPADGEYMINIADMAQALWVYNMEFKNTVLVTVDGAEVYRTSIGGNADQKAIDQHGVSQADKINQRLKNIRFKATAGQHEIGVTFLARTFAESDNRAGLTGARRRPGPDPAHQLLRDPRTVQSDRRQPDLEPQEDLQLLSRGPGRHDALRQVDRRPPREPGLS